MIDKRFTGARVFVLGSGPSLTQADVDRVRNEHVICANSSVKYAPWADVLYACDLAWWKRNQDLWRDFKGIKATWSKPAADLFRLTYIKGKNGQGLGRKCLHAGGGSGYMAIGLAYLMGARKICLLGFDSQHTGGKSHFHGDHPGANPSPRELKLWAALYPRLYNDLQSEGVELVNCTRRTALTIPHLPLEAVIGGV